MNAKIKNTLLVGMMVLLFSACVSLSAETEPVETPESTILVVEDPTSIPTVVPIEESVPEGNGQYIGLVYPPLPAGLSTGFSMVIYGSDDNGLSFVSDGESRMLWLEKAAQYESNGSVTWEVADVLDMSKIESGSVLIPDGCSLNGSIDNEIIVIAKNGVVRMAWRANTTSDRFEVLATKGITCDSDKGMQFE